MGTTTILSGKFKGRAITIPDAVGFRPTQSKVRKSLFDLLPPLEGWKVADLYAGAGTLGFEALSRGAASVTFVDWADGAIRALRKNQRAFPPDLSIAIVRTDVARFLVKDHEGFDLILADPPYGAVDLAALKEQAMKRLNESGFLVIEGSKRDPWFVSRADVRTYGDTCLAILQRPE